MDQWFKRTLNAIEAMVPSNSEWLLWSMTKSEWAAWIQAIFSLVGIFAAIGIAFWQWYSERKRRINENRQQAIEELNKQLLILGAVRIAAEDAKNALWNVKLKISEESHRSPKSSLPRVEGLERTFDTLLAKDIPAEGIKQILIILCELSYSKNAIHEVALVDGESIEERTSKAVTRYEKMVGCVSVLKREERILRRKINNLKTPCKHAKSNCFTEKVRQFFCSARAK